MRLLLIIGSTALVLVLGVLLWELRAGSDSEPGEPRREATPSGRIVTATDTGPRPPISVELRSASPRPSLARDTDRPAAPPPTAGAVDPPAGAPQVVAADAGVPEPKPGHAPRDRIKELKRLLKHKDYEGAYDAAVAVMTEYPDEVEGYITAGMSACAMGELEHVQQILRTTPMERTRARIVQGCGIMGMTVTDPAPP